MRIGNGASVVGNVGVRNIYRNVASAQPLLKCSLRELSTIYNHLFTTDVCKRIEMMSIYILLLFGLRYRWNTQDLIDGKYVIMDGSYLGM